MRLFQDFLGGALDADLLTAGTSMSSPALAAMLAVASPDTMTIVIDPDGIAGAPETVHITAHTASATTATVTRGQEGTTARDHLSGTDWVAPVTANDLADSPTHRFTAGTVDTTQSLTNGAWAILNWTAPAVGNDPLGMWSAGQPARVTIPAGGAGWYLILGGLHVPVGTGDVVAGFSFNSTTPGSTDSFSWNRQSGAPERDMPIHAFRYLNDGDFVSMQMYHNTGATRNPGSRTNMKLVRLFSEA
jgi:hypothetical protein